VKLKDCIEDYFAFIQHEQRVEQATLETYKSWLRHLYRWLEANGYPDPDLSVFSTITLRRFLYYLSGEKKYRPRTIRGVFYPIKGLARHLVENGALAENPCLSIKMPKKDAAVRLTVSADEVAALLAACERQYKPRQIALSRAILCVLVYGGLRRSELMNLRLSNFNGDEKSILIANGKGNKSRKVFVCETCLAALREWLAMREPDTTTDYLFTFDRSRRVHERGLHTIVEQVKAAAGMADRTTLTPHVLRHFYASHLMQQGAPLTSIQHALGHANLTTTAQYLHVNEQSLREIASLSELPAKATSAPAPAPATPAPVAASARNTMRVMVRKSTATTGGKHHGS
jgi:site-specific recombinase XerD